MNLLDNWDFTNPVNQRGQSSYTGGNYTLDRWKFPDTPGTLTVKSGGIGISFKSPETFTSIGQYFENLESLIGKTVTASILLSDGIIRSVTFKNLTSTSDVSGADFGSGYLNLLMPYNCFRVMITKNSSITIKAVKLELGEVSTLKNDVLGVSYAEELRKCQRYYYRIGNNSDSYTTLKTISAWQENASFFVMHFPIPMRIQPVLGFKNLTALSNNRDTLFLSPLSCEIQQIVNDNHDVPFVRMSFYISNTPFGDSTLLVLRQNGYIDFSADL